MKKLLFLSLVLAVLSNTAALAQSKCRPWPNFYRDAKVESVSDWDWDWIEGTFSFQVKIRTKSGKLFILTCNGSRSLEEKVRKCLAKWAQTGVSLWLERSDPCSDSDSWLVGERFSVTVEGKLNPDPFRLQLMDFTKIRRE